MAKNDDHILSIIKRITELGARTPGSEAEISCHRLVEQELKGIDGGRISIDEFSFDKWVPEKQSLKDPRGREIPVRQLGYSGPGQIRAPLRFCENGTKEDCQGAEGCIAVCSSGPGRYKFLHRIKKYSNSLRAGALGFILVGNPGHGPPMGIIRKRKAGKVPAVSISYDESRKLRYDLAEEHSLTVENRIVRSRTRNTSWVLDGREPGIILSAHCDSWGPGAWDNASGVALLLSVARRLLREKIEHKVHMVFTGAEEFGLWGSRRLAQLASQDYGFAINVDGVGLSGSSLQVRCSDMDLSRIPPLRNIYSSLPLTTSGDHWSFHKAGIRTLFVTCNGTNTVQHTDQDRPHCLSVDKLQSSIALIMEIIAYLDSIA